MKFSALILRDILIYQFDNLLYLTIVDQNQLLF